MKKALEKNIAAWLLIAILIIITFSVLSSFFSEIATVQPFQDIFRFGNQLATLFFQSHLIPYVLCFIFVVDVLYYQWRFENKPNKPLVNFCLLSANLILCSTQLNFDHNNLLIGGCVFLASALVILLGHLIRRKREKDNTKYTPSDHEDDNGDNTQREIWNKSLNDIKNSYAIQKANAKLKHRLLISDEKNKSKLDKLKGKNEKKKVRLDNSIERQKEKGKKKPGKIHLTDIWFWLVYWIVIAVFFFVLIRPSILSTNKNPEEILNSIASFIEPFSNKEPAMAVIGALGGVCLWIIALFLIIFLLLSIGRVLKNFASKNNDDDTVTKIASDELRMFVYGLIDNALQLILIFPDFLSATIELLFDVNPISEKIIKWHDNINEVKITFSKKAEQKDTPE